VRPDADGHASPGQGDLGMVLFLLGNLAYGIGKGKGLSEVAEGVGASQAMPVLNRPFLRQVLHAS